MYFQNRRAEGFSPRVGESMSCSERVPQSRKGGANQTVNTMAARHVRASVDPPVKRLPDSADCFNIKVARVGKG